MTTYAVYFENAGSPATSLSPVVATLVELDGDAVAAPSITEVAGGFYSFSLSPAEVLLVVIDGGAGLPAEDRYVQGVLDPADGSFKLLNGNVGPLADAFAQIGAGQGVRNITLHVEDGDGADVEDALIDVYVQNGDYVTGGQTDENGELVVTLMDGDYQARVFKSGVAFTPKNFSVSGDATVGVVGSSAVPDPPDSPELCRVYVDLVNMDGTPDTNAQVRVENRFNNPGSTSPLVAVGDATYTADENGRVTMDLVRGMQVRVALGYTPFAKDFVVPDQTTVDLASIIGDPVDSMVPVVTP